LQGNAGQNTSQFLRIGAGARALGLGEAYGPVAEGAEAIYWNPAGLASQAVPEFHYSRTEFARFFHHDFAAYAHPVGKGTLAASLTRFSQDELPLVTNGNVTVGSFSPHSEAVSFAYARLFSSDTPPLPGQDDLYSSPEPEAEPSGRSFKLGLALKVIRETIYQYDSTAVSADGGVIYHPARDKALGLSAAFRNVGTKQKFISQKEDLPSELALGVSYSCRWEQSRLLPALEATFPYQGLSQLKIGLEYSRPAGEGSTVAFRMGYKALAAADLNPLAGLTAGLGAGFKRFSADFAFQPMAELGQAYRMSLAFRW
jgi:hypothetical protein